ncbi:MAG: hypothetical protein IJ072_03830 [Oscillospiraceae bacterium]|nr:hypothetical protein [Oscillospiraceae bacterium]
MEKTRLIIAAPQEQLSAARSHGFPTAHLIYAVAPDGALSAADCPPAQDCTMAVDISRYCGTSPRELAAQIMRELKSRGYRSLLLDTGRSVNSRQRQLAGDVCRMCGQAGTALFTYPALYDVCPGSYTLIGTALSGGSLDGHLRYAQKRFGKLAIEIELCQRDFSLPSPDGQGLELTPCQLRFLCERYPVRRFFSQELCADYFTYKFGRIAHLVLYDTAHTVAAKLDMASRLGIEYAFVHWRDISGCIQQLKALYRPS